MKQNSQVKIILSVAITGLTIGATSAFAQVNPSAPPAPETMHRPQPAVNGSNAGKKK